MTGFELQEGKWYTFLSNKDKYSKEKLEGDIENLESFYLDRGYLKFSIESSQVSVSKNKEDVFIQKLFSDFKDEEDVIKDITIDESINEGIINTEEAESFFNL